ncbi:ATP-binding protein [Streptomyces sp. IBSBF 3136]|uniref:ATP-binding protein n=1 Tax=Streptomyces sp. IBSBF 3136 TaxID=2903524 RepID=UPI002FDBC59C
MVIPLRNQAKDEHREAAALRYSAVWDTQGPSLADTRQAVRTLLSRAGHPPDQQPSQDAQIVVSELVTNALRHAPGPGELLLELTGNPALLRITVRDTSRTPPRPAARTPDRIGGHGLHLIARLCDRLHTVLGDQGKHVIAELRLHKAPAP